MTLHSNVLGIDIGSVSVSLVEVTPERETVNTAYAFHHGNITRTVRTLLEDIDLPGICGIAATTSTPRSGKPRNQLANPLNMRPQAPGS